MDNIIGIDLGTTYSAVSTIDDYGRPVLLKNSDGERLTPSAVCFNSDGSVTTGAEAKELLESGETNVAVFFKRTMGDPDYLFTAGNGSHTPSDISARLLERLRNDAEEQTGRRIDGAVITVPAYFGNAERRDVIDAAEKAGLNLLVLCNEPTAAALSYSILHPLDGRYLVYDLGGGTFDVSVVEAHGTDISILAVNGDHHLGGKDWDDMIVRKAIEKFETEFGDDLSEDLETYNQLLFSAEQLKKKLSSMERASLTVRYNGNRMKYELTRQEFQQLTEYLLETTTLKSEEALGEAGLTWADIEGVLLVGGSTRMPAVGEWVRRVSGKAPLGGVNPDEAVCLGAAVRAAMEATARDNSENRVFGLKGVERRYAIAGGVALSDVMSHSLGAVAVSTDGKRYVNSIIIPKNKPIPATETRPFEHQTVKGQKNELEVYVTQGESDNVAECRLDARYVVNEIPYAADGKTIVDISYSYDSSGVIRVGVSDHLSGKVYRVERKPLPNDMGWLYEEPRGKGGRLDIAVLIDESGSMYGDAMKKARAAALEFIDRLDLSRTRVAICGFTDDIHTHCKPTSDISKLQKAVGSLKANGGNGYDALKGGYSILLRGDDGAKRVMIVLTDGEWYAGDGPYHTSDKCRKEGIDIIAMGFGYANEEFLKRISTISVMTDLDRLTENFSTIARELSTGNAVGNIRLK